MAKSIGTFEEQTRIPIKLTIEKTSSRQKRNTIDQFLQILFHADMTKTKRSTFQQKNCKINPFVVESFLEFNWKRFIKSAVRENFNLKADPQIKKTQAT